MSNGAARCVGPGSAWLHSKVQRLVLSANEYSRRPRAPARLCCLLYEVELEAVVRKSHEPVTPRVAVVATEAQRSRAAYRHAVVHEGLRAVRVTEQHELDVVSGQ